MFGIRIAYQKNRQSLLAQLCDLHGSDKGEVAPGDHPYPWPSHTYTDAYEMLFSLGRHSVELVLECGIGTNNPSLSSNMTATGKPGASLRVWRDYFPNACVIGLDIDQDILFTEDRIQTYQCDQTAPWSIQDFAERAAIMPWGADIIIDDGLHKFEAGRTLFEGLRHLLKPEGVYVIEDIGPKDKVRYRTYLDSLQDEWHARFIDLYRPNISLKDNSLIVISRPSVQPGQQ